MPVFTTLDMASLLENAEYKVLCLAIGEAERLAAAGDVSGGYECLLAGLYRAVDQYGVAGAIVTDLDHDGVYELQGALKNLSGHFEQIVPIASVEPKDGALEVAVPAGGGAFSNVILHQVTAIDF